MSLHRTPERDSRAYRATRRDLNALDAWRETSGAPKSLGCASEVATELQAQFMDAALIFGLVLGASAALSTGDRQ